jgi:hypothetical protein
MNPFIFHRQAIDNITHHYYAQSGEWTLLPFRYSSMNSIYARLTNQAFAVQGADATASARLSSSINQNIGNF